MVVVVTPMSSIGPIGLGDTREQVRLSCSEHSMLLSSENNCEDYFGGNCIKVCYSSEDVVEYIELSSGRGVVAMLWDIEVFAMPAVNVIERIEMKCSYNKNDPELGYSYIFNELELSFWRPVLPEDENDKEGMFFMTVGIGEKGYFGLI